MFLAAAKPPRGLEALGSWGFGANSECAACGGAQLHLELRRGQTPNQESDPFDFPLTTRQLPKP